PNGTQGPFTSANLFPASITDAVRAVPGVKQADPIVLFRQTVRVPSAKDVNVIGYTPGGVGQPTVTKGRLPNAAHEIVVDRSLHVGIGHTIVIGGTAFHVVGTVKGITYLGGSPATFISAHDAQMLLLHGSPLATAIVVRGTPSAAMPAGYTALPNHAAQSD